MYALAKIFFTGRRGVSQDVPRAVALLERAVQERKHPRSMIRLAALLRHGWSMPRDLPRALQLFEKASTECNSIEATFALANMLESGGQGIQQDEERAEQLYEKCLQQGGPARTMFKIAYGLTHNQFLVKNGPRAVRFYEAAIAIESHTRSKFMLARMLIHGTDGVTRDEPRALRLYEEAANESNHLKSMSSLGMYYAQEEEPGKFKDLQKAKQWLIKAAVNGSESAVNRLGEILEGHADKLNFPREEALKLFELVLEKYGSDSAKYNIAWLVSSGHGIPINLMRAVTMYVASMNAGLTRHGQAAYNLGRILEKGGREIHKCPRQASLLYERATRFWRHTPSVIRQWELYKRERCNCNIATSPWHQRVAVLEEAASVRKDIGAMCTLADVLRTGPWGVKVDASRARQMYESAIAEGEWAPVWRKRAMTGLASLLETGGEGVDVDSEKALEWYRKAGEEGEKDALFRLGQLAEQGGYGMKVDKRRARSFYELAVKRGHVKGMVNLVRMLHYGVDGIEADRKGAIHLYLRVIAEKEEVDVEMVVGLALLMMEGRGKRPREQVEEVDEEGDRKRRKRWMKVVEI